MDDPTVYEYNTKSRFSNISRTSWNSDFTKSMSSGEEEREEVIGGSGSDRGSVGEYSLACMTSYLWNSVIIIIIIIQLYFRPQPIDTHIFKYKIQIQHGRIYTVEYVHISVIYTVYSAHLYNQ